MLKSDGPKHTPEALGLGLSLLDVDHRASHVISPGLKSLQ